MWYGALTRIMNKPFRQHAGELFMYSMQLSQFDPCFDVYREEVVQAAC